MKELEEYKIVSLGLLESTKSQKIGFVSCGLGQVTTLLGMVLFLLCSLHQYPGLRILVCKVQQLRYTL